MLLLRIEGGANIFLKKIHVKIPLMNERPDTLQEINDFLLANPNALRKDVKGLARLLRMFVETNSDASKSPNYANPAIDEPQLLCTLWDEVHSHSHYALSFSW
jgi:hypothetical protein